MQELCQRAQSIDQEVQKLNLQLERLAVDEEDYLSEPASTEFNEEDLQSLEDELEAVDNKLSDAQKDMESLKQMVCNETGDEISAPWSQILQHLRERREEAILEYRQQTAEILAKIGVSQTLEKIRAKEDEKIRRDLKAEEVTSLLSSVTGYYDSIDLIDDQVVVSGKYGNYPLSELSTGAQEQVQLAIRMGFASRLTGGQPLFLILDDAFQYSDWQRRERLIEKVIQLTHEGWQVTYLTMDNHIRDLCRSMGEEALGNEFCYEKIG